MVPGYRFTQGSRFASNPGLQLANAFGVMAATFGVIDAINDVPPFFMMRWLGTWFRAKMICFFEDYDYVR